MQEKEHKTESGHSFPYVPIVILVMFFVSAYLTYVRAYESGAVRFFLEEDEIEKFDPIDALYGND